MALDRDALERARAAAAKVEEIEAMVRDRDAWSREAVRLEAELERARTNAENAVAAHERAANEARASRGLFGAVRDRLSGNLAEGRDDRRARKDAEEAGAASVRLAAETLFRKLESDLDAARRKLLHADGAAGLIVSARAAERKAFAGLAGGGSTEIETLAAELQKLERRAEPWRPALRAAISRRDHSVTAFEQLSAFRAAWPELTTCIGDVVAGEAGPVPPDALEHLRRAHAALYAGARAGIAALSTGVLADLVRIAAHEITQPRNVRAVAAGLTRALQDLEPIAAAAAKTLADLETNLANTEAACERVREQLHAKLLAPPTRGR